MRPPPDGSERSQLGQNPGRDDHSDDPVDEGNRSRQRRHERDGYCKQDQQRGATLNGRVDRGAHQHEQRQQRS